jgi:predicted phosphodiesterase
VHRELLSDDDVSFLGCLLLTASFRAAGTTFFSVHASPDDQLYRYTLTPDAPDDHLQTEIGSVSADYILLGHTHLPMIRRVGSRVVVNPGSVGQPRDGDPRASYAVIEDGAVTLKRASYAVERTIRDLEALPLDHAVTERLAAILRTGKA